MPLGNNRYYKTRSRAAVSHAARMAELQAQGMSREAASAQAYQEITRRKPKAEEGPSELQQEIDHIDSLMG